jgi:hypothetical protein
MGKVVYIGGFLDESGRESLRHIVPDGMKEVLHHVTIVFKPDDKQVSAIVPYLGTEQVLRVKGYVFDEKACAVLVEFIDEDLRCMCRNEHVHITVGLVDGVPAKYSNELFGTGRECIGLEMELVVRVGVFCGGEVVYEIGQ